MSGPNYTTPVNHLIPCPESLAGHLIVASIQVPDISGMSPNRYAVAAFDHQIGRFTTWVIYPVDPYTESDKAEWAADQGHYGKTWPEALQDMTDRAIREIRTA